MHINAPPNVFFALVAMCDAGLSLLAARATLVASPRRCAVHPLIFINQFLIKYRGILQSGTEFVYSV